MRKMGVFSTTIFLSIIIGGIYGMLHDQVTATISPEYFTKFKFPQFNIATIYSFRKGVAIVGFFATWWVGAIIGIVLALVALIFPDHKFMKAAVAKALVLVFATTILAGILGYIYGTTILNKATTNWWIPDEVMDKSSFITVGAIHNAGYIGSLLGLILAVVLMLWKRWNKRI